MAAAFRPTRDDGPGVPNCSSRASDGKVGSLGPILEAVSFDHERDSRTLTGDDVQLCLPEVPVQILGHRKTTQCPTLPAPKPRGRREGLDTPCYNCALNYCGGIICRCVGVKRESAGTARAARHF